MERCAATYFAVHLNLAGMFLNNAVAHGKAEARSTSLTFNNSGFGSEEWIVDAAKIFCRDARPGVANDHFDLPIVDGFDPQYPALCHGIFSVEKQVEEYLLELPHVAQDVR